MARFSSLPRFWITLSGLLVTAAHAGSSTRAPIQLDGRLTEPAWQQVPVLRSFVLPWSDKQELATAFRAFADDECLYLAFEAEDEQMVVEDKFPNESVVDREDRVEIFFARDPKLEQYYCLEIDPLGRVHDYAARSYRQFESGWNCAGLRTSGRQHARGYTVEASIPLSTLRVLLDSPVAPGSTLRVGLFRADFRPGALGDAAENWLSWIRPTEARPDFHVPSAFADWQIPPFPRPEATFRTRGVVLLPSDLSLADWPERAAQAGLTTIALHHGSSPKVVAEFIATPNGRDFLARCAKLGLHVEYELHAMAELLPRRLFAAEPELFRMNEKGDRTPDANLCVHSNRAMEIIATNAVRMAQELTPTTSRYFFWGDDGLPWCRCDSCRNYSDSEQALLLVNHLIRRLRPWDPNAAVAHLAYANTLAPPQRVRPEPGVFLEFAPINRRYDLPYAEQVDSQAKDTLGVLRANLEVFPAATAQVLEYWLDISRFSKWKRPAVELPWREELLAADARSYRQLGIRNVTTFAAWLDTDYVKRFGQPTVIQIYGDTLRSSGD